MEIKFPAAVNISRHVVFKIKQNSCLLRVVCEAPQIECAVTCEGEVLRLKLGEMSRLQVELTGLLSRYLSFRFDCVNASLPLWVASYSYRLLCLL